ncbi:uracil-DNA glycosylase family protein, partial [Proteus mirabilis]|uniref:uracil-DNA glycosylase family protein n=1 Tax=Proteus mirabilis TaxID=584 RepID=UPI0023B7D4FE
LYETLIDFGLANGVYDERPDDGLTLIDTRITNAVRCVPPENKPTTAEIGTCRPFLSATVAAMPRLSAIVALGHRQLKVAPAERPSHQQAPAWQMLLTGPIIACLVYFTLLAIAQAGACW